MLTLPPLSALAIALLALAPGLARSCDALLGTYATEAGGDGVVHIVKTKGAYVLSTRRGPDDEWRVLEESMRSLGHAQLLGALPVDIDAQACGLAGREHGMGKILLKVKPGTTYRDNARTGQNRIETRTSTSGVLFYQAQGIVASGVDLYPVPFSGKQAVVPPKPVRPAAGHEVPLAAQCPGQRLPDLTQARFNALPAYFRKSIAKYSVADLRAFVCGQELHALLTGHDYSGAREDDGGRRRRINLLEAQDMLKAGLVPRDEEGKPGWWAALSNLAIYNEPNGHEKRAVPLQREYYAFMQEQLLPRTLDGGAAPDRDARLDAMRFLGETVYLPPAIGLALMRQLKAMGVTAWRIQDGERTPNLAAVHLGRTAGPGVPLEVFDFMLEAAGAEALRDYSTLDSLIISGGAEKLRHFLRAGLDPSAVRSVPDMLSRAQQYGKEAVYNILRDDLQRRGTVVAPYVDLDALKEEKWRVRQAIEATYQCHPLPEPGQAQRGEGAHGCYFVLYSPEHGRLLANTNYMLEIRAPGDHDIKKAAAIAFFGVTDGAGRSEYVRFPFKPEAMGVSFLQSIGQGANQRHATALRAAEAGAAAEAVPLQPYLIRACGKVVHESVSDFTGSTVFYRSTDPCPLKVEFKDAQ